MRSVATRSPYQSIGSGGKRERIRVVRKNQKEAVPTRSWYPSGMKALLAAREKPLIVPGVHDVLSALIAERQGAEAVFLSGYALTASSMGLPDLGYLSLDRLRDAATSISTRLSIPLLVDADTGFGNALHVVETTRSLIRAGAKGLFLEDQNNPKRCGHMRGKELAPRGEYFGKLRAAIDARADADFLIVARTDAIAAAGLEEAILRANEAHRIGADLLFIEAPEDGEMIREIAARVPGPKLINLVEGGKTPHLSREALFELGFVVHLHPVTGLYAATAALTEAYGALVGRGSPIDSGEGNEWRSDVGTDFQTFAELLDLESYFEQALRYRGDEEDKRE